MGNAPQSRRRTPFSRSNEQLPHGYLEETGNYYSIVDRLLLCLFRPKSGPKKAKKTLLYDHFRDAVGIITQLGSPNGGARLKF